MKWIQLSSDKQFRKRREKNIQKLKDAEETISTEIQRIILRYKLKHGCDFNYNASYRAVTQMLSNRMLALTVRAYARLEKQARLNKSWLQKQQRCEMDLCDLQICCNLN